MYMSYKFCQDVDMHFAKFNHWFKPNVTKSSPSLLVGLLDYIKYEEIVSFHIGSVHNFVIHF